jgi:ribonuclease HII
MFKDAFMAWQVGVDEAGYGPNLGPLVMGVVCCQAPASRKDLWHHMRKVVRRHDEEDDGRLLVADSKLVFNPTKGLRCLESAVLAFLHGGERLGAERPCRCLLDLLDVVCPHSLDEMRKEWWFHGTTAVPLVVAEDELLAGADGWRRSTKTRGLNWGLAAAVLVATERFNSLVDSWGSKGAVLGAGLTDLLRFALALPGDDALLVTVDKHGGRNSYGAILQNIFEEGMVLVRDEGAEGSVYDVVGLGRPIRVTFRPRADMTAFCVALASMICKYLRETLMGEFNQYWVEKVPGLAPTAGYPGDSRRFYSAIEPELSKLGISRERIWRER